MRRMTLRCRCGEHVFQIPQPLREQLFGDLSLESAPWPVRLIKGERAPEPGDPYDVPVGDMTTWFNRAMRDLEGRRWSLPTLYTLLGRKVTGEVVPTHVYLRSERAGTVLLEALQSPIVAAFEYFTARMLTDGDSEDWATRFGLPGALPVAGLDWLDPEPPQVDPDRLQGVLWRTPFQLQRGNLFTCFKAELTALSALISHVARTGERLIAHVAVPPGWADRDRTGEG
jgi:hypothetical protein